LRCYKGYSFSILKHRISIYSFGIQVGRDFNKGFLFLITKEIIAIKDNVYNFAKNFESGGYRGFGERGNGKSG